MIKSPGDLSTDGQGSWWNVKGSGLEAEQRFQSEMGSILKPGGSEQKRALADVALTGSPQARGGGG